MSITGTGTQVAAARPAVGVVSQTDSAILAGLQGGDPSVGGLLGALNDQAQQANDLLSKLQPNLGQNVNALA